MFKVRDDPRVPPVGGFLRRHSLDELPQLVNALRGEMGAPLIESEDRQVGGRFRRTLAITPGLTGLWQVNGLSGIPFDEMVTLDYLYSRTGRFGETQSSSREPARSYSRTRRLLMAPAFGRSPRGKGSWAVTRGSSATSGFLGRSAFKSASAPTSRWPEAPPGRIRTHARAVVRISY